MNRTHEKLLVAALAGLVIASAAAFAVQPALASGYDVEAPAVVTGVQHWDVLNVRKWPASYSKRIGALAPQSSVWVERCIEAPQGASDWCLVEAAGTRGWVNARFLTPIEDWDI